MIMKKCILLQKIAFFSLFCELQTMKMEFSATFLQLSYVVIYLVNYLNLEKSCLKIHFHFLQLTKKAEKAIFWSEIQTFLKTMLASFANIPNLLGHPVQVPRFMNGMVKSTACSRS